jgi:hypothetical protein
MKKKFVWQKWIDPLLSNYEETEWPGYDLDEDGDKIPIHTVERQPVLHTPFGVVSVVDDAMASKSFDFWLLHTNFDLTEGMASLISQVPGVETLEVYTRYRARVGFPRSELFVSREVMHEVEQAILALSHGLQNQLLIGIEQDAAEKVIDARDKVEKKFEHWAIWVVPNGNMEVLGSDKLDDEYQQRLSLLKQVQDSVGGRLLTSESE